MHTHIIYVPGLGSRYNSFRRTSLKSWRFYNVSTELIEIDWYDNNDFNHKMSQVTAAVSRAKGQSRVVVVGESAGATLALHSAKLPGVSRVITLCGVAVSNTPLSPYMQQKSPSLYQATRSIPSTERYDVRSVRALVDTVVGKKYSTALGAKSYIFWSIGHISTIIICLTFLAPLMVTIAKKSKT